MAKLFRYFVEGECEKKLIEVLNHQKGGRFHPGKVEVFNIIRERFSPSRAMNIKIGSTVVFVYDSDIKDISILEENINMIKKYAKVPDSHIKHLISIDDLEDELVYSTNIKNINDLFNTKSKAEFKNKFINHKDIWSCLKKHNFDENKLWSRKAKTPFDKYNHNKK